MPAAVEVYINYDLAVPVTNKAPEAALALLKYFHRPASRPVWDKAGLEVVGRVKRCPVNGTDIGTLTIRAVLRAARERCPARGIPRRPSAG